jgi:oligopeptide/dipeptide ABC transporter ATP-binding protein
MSPGKRREKLMAFLEVKNLKKYFPTPAGELHAVDDVSFTIEKGKTLGVVGESGCGKSTLGKTIIRLTNPTSGQVIYNGQDIAFIPIKKFQSYRSNIQMIFQDPYASLDPRMTVEELIAEPLKLICRIRDKNEIAARVAELMKQVKLSDQFRFSYPHELDGGRRQRIGVARALATNPEFVICDEPVSALDVSVQAQVLNLLQDLQEQHGLTYMFITHDMSVVKHISDDILVMYLGQIVEKSSVDELFNHTLHPYSQALLSAIPVPSLDHRNRAIPMKGEVFSPVEPKPGCRFASRCPFATEECHTATPVLTEYTKGHFVACHHTGKVDFTTKSI